MSTIATADLTGAALDWAVGIAQGWMDSGDGYFIVPGEKLVTATSSYCPSSEWSLAGPIIEHEGISARKHSSGTWYAMARADVGDGQRTQWCEFTYRGDERLVHPRRQRFSGSTMLEAAMRCYVASKLGASIEVPAELAA